MAMMQCADLSEPLKLGFGATRAFCLPSLSFGTIPPNIETHRSSLYLVL